LFKKIAAQKKPSWVSKFLIAASITLIFSVGIFYVFNKNTLNNQEVFAANFEPYPNVMHPVVRGDENSSEIEKAFVFYENENYAAFIEALESSHFKNNDYNFYLANAYLATKNTDKAILLLENYLENPNPKYKTDAHWYLGIAYFKIEDIKAKVYLQKVINAEDFHLEEAIKLLAYLD
jgi:tetratricopeptide (TPR) repeat protein